MDPEEVKAVMRSHGVDLWALIESVITVAVRDHGSELRSRRDSIVALLYSSETATRCRNCGQDGGDEQGFDSRGNEGKEVASPDGKRSVSSSPPRSEPEEFDDEEDDDEQRRILAIKDRIDDPDQPEEKLVMLLQNLLDMDITFKALKETDVGRHVNGLRKHPSGEVRRLVKLLVRKWKELVDEWVKSSSDGALPAIITDGDSPPQLVSGKTSQNGHQVLDFGFSPNPHNGGLGVEMESRGKVIPRKEAPPPKNSQISASSVTPPAGIKESLIDPERLASARKRLHENYQEAQNAKKQRTIQVMDIHEIPKPKNSFISRNKGGPQGKHR
ncbi:Transcription factor IIS N-terminal protein [Dioscorea alata]|uniref:Transcription factor IIS N-terminal protein n=1 Tax=Dioscorea alata TaxID=55571 RepID=A0ACB7WCG1_DIOAL|nr:Transcription factor IIS N-terminal protein [Dioscorea alata]